MIQEESKQVLQQNIDNGQIQDQDSTLKVYKWVESIYTEFWNDVILSDFQKQQEMWPIPNIKTIQLFIEWMQNKKYSIKTIQDVILPGLNFCHHQRNVKFTRECKLEFKNQLMKWKKSHRHEIQQKSKNPVMLQDLKQIIINTPDEIFSKAAETSLFLFAFYTGSRSITCEHILLKDICQIHQLQSNGNVIVQINLRVTKGNYNWNHIVTLEENKQDRSMDFVYWLFRHLQKNHNIQKFEQLDQENLQQTGLGNLKLWIQNRKQMQTLFKRRSEKAGFPKGLLSFHSLRAGFMSQSILVNNGNSSALEKTALIGGWVPNGSAQLKYISETTKKLMIATRLLQPQTSQQLQQPQQQQQNDNQNSIPNNLLQQPQQQQQQLQLFLQPQVQQQQQQLNLINNQTLLILNKILLSNINNNNNNNCQNVIPNRVLQSNQNVIEQELGQNSVLFHNLKQNLVSKWDSMNKKQISWRYRPQKKISKPIKKPSERNYWTQEEISILKKEKDSNPQIKWVSIADILKQKGFKPRSGRDIQSKWKSLNNK